MQQVDVNNKNKYAISIVGRLNEMRKQRRNCDFVIRIGSDDIPAHRSVLCASSDYFCTMMTTDTKESQSGIVEMTDVDFECAKVCVCHVYGEEVFILANKGTELMFVAGLMKLRGLCDIVAAWLRENLDIESFYTVKSIGETHGYTDLVEKCNRFAADNLVMISKDEKFGGIDKVVVMEAIKRVKICEVDKLEVLLKWVKCSLGDIMDVIDCVDLRKIPAHHLRYLIENEAIIRNTADCLLHFSLTALDVAKVSPRREPKSVIAIFDKVSGHLQCYNPRDHTLKEMHKFHKDMMEKCFTAATLGNYIYILMQTRMVYRLEYANKRAKWQRLSSMTEDHGLFPPATVLSNFIYVVSSSHQGLSNSAERYNPETNRWTKLKRQTTPLKNATPVAVNKSIYTFGGSMGARFTGITTRYTPSKSKAKWLQMKSMVRERAIPGAVALNEKVYVMGGFRPFGCVMEIGEHKHELECYDVATGQWSFLKPMISARYWCRGLAVDGAIFAVGSYFSESDTIEKYNVEKNEWSEVEIPNNTKLKILDAVEIKLVDGWSAA